MLEGWPSHFPEEEQRFLAAIVLDPDAETNRLIYADWLEEQGDQRAEYLRLETRLAQIPKDHPEYPLVKKQKIDCQSRLLKGRESMYGNKTWFWLLHISRRTIIANCARGSKAKPRLRFAFECPQQWNNLETTGADGVRFCSSCNERVFFCNTPEEGEHHASLGHCIALSLSAAEAAAEAHPAPMMLGRPSLPRKTAQLDDGFDPWDARVEALKRWAAEFLPNKVSRRIPKQQ